jgi:hypothetical protein
MALSGSMIGPGFHGENKSLSKSNTLFRPAGIYYRSASGFKKP